LRREWPNGAVFLARENSTAASIVFHGVLPASGLAEDRTTAGLADLTAGALLRGTERRSFAQIYEALESVGAALSVHGGKTSASFHGKCLPEDLPLLLDILADALLRPTFPPDGVAQLKAERITGLAIRDQDTGAMADLTFDALAYPNHPYSLPGEGFRDSVSGLSADDLSGFHRRAYRPRGLILAIVGCIDRARAEELAASHLGGWAAANGAGWAEVPAAAAPAGLIRQAVVLPEKAQADLVVGAPGPSRFAQDYVAATLVNNILGRFGMMGRLGERIREKAGLAYYAYSHVEGGPGPGAWKAVAGVRPDRVERTVEMIRQEIGKLLQSGVTRRELTDSQTQFVGRLPLQMETNEGVAAALVHLERFRLGLDYYHRYPAIVRTVSREDAAEAARTYLHPDRLVVGIAGPPGEGGTG
jgi:zinc protease